MLTRDYSRKDTRRTIGFLWSKERKTPQPSSKMLRSRPLKLYKRDVPYVRYRGTGFSGIFSLSLPFSLDSPSFILPLLENFHDASRIKPGRKADAMKSSPVKASRKLGKILFTFPQRAKTMMIKAESPYKVASVIFLSPSWQSNLTCILTKLIREFCYPNNPDATSQVSCVNL